MAVNLNYYSMILLSLKVGLSYKDGLKSSYDAIPSVDDFLKALQHWWKKCVDCKGDCVEK